jgi:phenylacetate-coenzyme A ligase PaaK-like adenylate-forming protein
VKPDRLIVRRTSGSTGEPLRILRTWMEEQLLGLFRLRASLDFGLRVHDRVASVVRVRPRHPRDRRPLGWALQASGLCRQLEIECLQRPEVIARALHAFRPDMLGGFTGVLARVAQVFADDESLRCRPRCVVTGAEVSTPEVRSGIAEALRAPVFDTYASHEFRLIAWQCKHTGEYHTCDDSVIVEALVDGRPAEPGERGRVVVTALHSWAMPFIRYALDDVITRGSERCACGSAFGTIQRIEGRDLDYFALPGGELLHPYQLVPPLLDVGAAWIRQFQMAQEDGHSLTLRLIPKGTIGAEKLDQVRAALRPILGAAELRIRLVDELHPEPTGKFRLFVPHRDRAQDGDSHEGAS